MATAQVRYKAADRKEQILTIATGLFARQGFRGTTTKQIAEHAGVTEALIFRHFPSKEELYWAVIDRKTKVTGPAERMRERIQQGGTDLEILAGIAQEILERRAQDQTLSRLLLYSALESHRLSNRFFRTYVVESYEVLAEYVRSRMDAGVFRQLDPLLAARGFLGMVIYHSWVQDLFGGKRYQAFSVKEVSRTLAEVWLNGMLSPAGTSSGGGKSNGTRNNPRRQQGNSNGAH